MTDYMGSMIVALDFILEETERQPRKVRAILATSQDFLNVLDTALRSTKGCSPESAESLKQFVALVEPMLGVFDKMIEENENNLTIGVYHALRRVRRTIKRLPL